MVDRDSDTTRLVFLRRIMNRLLQLAFLILVPVAALPSQQKNPRAGGEPRKSNLPAYPGGSGQKDGQGSSNPAGPLDPLLDLSQPYLQPGFQAFRRTLPTLSVFPSYPQAMQGFGSYPLLPGAKLPGVAERTVPRDGFRPRPAPKYSHQLWPSWMLPGIGADGRVVTSDQAIVVRGGDRVWVLAPKETAYEALAFHDKMRFVRSGTGLRVRDDGEFSVAFHDGGQLRSTGPVTMKVEVLDEGVGHLRLDLVSRFWLLARARPFIVSMPDGSELMLKDTRVYIEADDHQKILLVYNRGPGTATLKSAVGEVEFKARQRVEVMQRPRSRTYRSFGLNLRGPLKSMRHGRSIEVEATGKGGVLNWCGARIEVAQGVAVRLDPLSGDGFPEDGSAGK